MGFLLESPAQIARFASPCLSTPRGAVQTMVEIPNTTPKRWRAEIPLWNAEEGESKLLLTVGLIEREDQFDIDYFEVTGRQ
jgi:hypothetical protein